MKMDNNELNEKWNKIKNHTCYYIDGIFKFKYFNFDSILLDERSKKTF